MTLFCALHFNDYGLVDADSTCVYFSIKGGLFSFLNLK